MESRTIARKDLYEQVWTTPMTKLAVEYGLSDRGLAKLCAREKIPVPGRGYLRRQQTGYRPKRPALPTLPGKDHPVTVRISDTPARAERREDLVRPEPDAGRERQGAEILIRRFRLTRADSLR
jgi:hypothetical protein